MSSEKVAVIISVYVNDKVDMIKEAFDSLFNQTYDNIDIFVYCDGPVSDDVEHYLDQLFLQCLIVLFKSNINNGLAFALNYLIEKVLENSTYSYIARMDSDDICFPNRIEKQVFFLNAEPTVDVCGTFCEEFGSSIALSCKKLPLQHEELVDFSIARCPFIHPTVMFKVSVFLDGVRYPQFTHMTEDLALWYDLIKNDYRLANLPSVQLSYRINDDTMLRRKNLLKVITEVKLRIKAMIDLKRVSLKNILLIMSRVVLAFMPSFFLKLTYKYFR